MALLLFLFWIVLNARVDADVLITGAVSAACIWIFAILVAGWSLKKEWQAIRLLPYLVMYMGSLFMEICKANMGVFQVIVSGKTSPCIRTIQTPLKTRLARVMLANAITLTPGTVTVQLVEDRLTVHCLTREMADGLTDFVIEKKLMEMEAKAVGKRV